jgi:hypothetical protein
MSQKPSVGRIVHYTSYGTPGGEYQSVCRAAVVTSVYPMDERDRRAMALLPDVEPYWIDLCVLNPEGMYFNRTVRHGGLENKGGTWHWPERVD